jgi:DNA-binding CsgD family transcriptional regulator
LIASLPDPDGREAGGVAPDAILGRERELAAISRLFEDGDRRPRALLLEGEAGIGKTTLWRAAVSTASRDGNVLEARASQTEAKLSFTVLSDLLAPYVEAFGADLPTEQRRALDAALMIGDADDLHPDARAVSLAALGMLRSVAAAGPVTIAIDDVQWADRPSAQAMTFVVRRIRDEPVRFLGARRIARGEHDPLGLSAHFPGDVDIIELGPLDPVDLGRMLRDQVGDDITLALARRIHEASGGNPFLAVEMARAMQRAGDHPLPSDPLPIPRDVEELLTRRLDDLTPGARDALLLAALSGRPTVDLVTQLGVEGGDIAESERAGIISTTRGAILFTHPLLASTVSSAAGDGERRAAHDMLGRVAIDPEERARHLALARTEPDEEIASALDAAAEHARSRGAPSAAAELYELAAFSTPPALATAQLIRVRKASGNLFDAGDTKAALELCSSPLDTLDHGHAWAETLYETTVYSWYDVQRIAPLLDQVLLEIGDDPHLRSRVLADRAWAHFQACEPREAADLARQAVDVAEGVGDPFILRVALAVLGLTAEALGDPDPATFDQGLALEGQLATGEVSGPSVCFGRHLLWAGDLEGARQILEEELARQRGQGHESSTWEPITHLAEVEFRAGRWDHSLALARDAAETAADMGLTGVRGALLPVLAMAECGLGLVEESRRHGLEALDESVRFGDRWDELAARWALGFLELSTGDAAAADRWLSPATSTVSTMGLREPGALPFAPDHVEALVTLGDTGRAAELTDRLEEQGLTLDRPLALATAQRCRALIAGSVGDLSTAADAIDRSLEEHARVRQPFELARSLLVAGEVRRRMKQKKPAREALDGAITNFEELGATLWVDRARAELARVGGRAPASGGLTPTEEQVAALVAQGRTNKEVADALFMSVHTVDANLRRVYRKLQVRSRAELARKF